jgi:predicted RNA polymerase sigma factor
MCCSCAVATPLPRAVATLFCGFSVSEIANALLASEDSIEKRLGRARKLFRDSGSLVEFSNPPAIATHIDAVYQAIYLLFNEGYHGSESEQMVREDLCSEALRLALSLSEHSEGAKPRTHALLALLCFQEAQGEFQFLSGRLTEAAKHFYKAMNLARTKPETIFFQKKIEACRPGLAEIDR